MCDQIERVFYAVIKYLLNICEISGENLFIDGTKIEANANRYTFVWKKAVAKNEKKLCTKLPVILDEINSAFGIKFPENTPVLDMISTLSSLMSKLGIVRVTGKGHHKSSYQKALEKLEEYAEKTARYEPYNSLFNGRNSFSKTDIDATFMRMKDDHMKNGQLKPGYNIQAAVEGEYILGIDVSSERSDVNTLIPFLEKFNGLELFVLKNIICDAGYESEENYLYLKSHNTTAIHKNKLTRRGGVSPPVIQTVCLRRERGTGNPYPTNFVRIFLCTAIIRYLNVYKKFKQKLAYMVFAQNFLSIHWKLSLNPTEKVKP